MAVYNGNQLTGGGNPQGSMASIYMRSQRLVRCGFSGNVREYIISGLKVQSTPPARVHPLKQGMIDSKFSSLWWVKVKNAYFYGTKVDVGSSYHCVAACSKCWIVHPFQGT